MRVIANSPSLCPTMFSVTYTGMCCLPLCTAIVSPTKSGTMVERLDQVLIGRLSFEPRAASTFFIRWWSTKGPFLIERAILRLSYARRRSRTIMTCVRLLRRGFLPLFFPPPRGNTGRAPPGRPPPPPPGGAGGGLGTPPPARGAPPPRLRRPPPLATPVCP